MTLSLQEITARQEALVREIAERQQLLAAYQLILADGEKAIADSAAEPTPAQEKEAPPQPEPPAPFRPAINF
jgi:hypothetical protein